jgi:hypothetical protein
MKLITRVLTTRLLAFIERLVIFEQFDLIKGRTTDNFLYIVDLVQSCHVPQDACGLTEA